MTYPNIVVNIYCLHSQNMKELPFNQMFFLACFKGLNKLSLVLRVVDVNPDFADFIELRFQKRFQKTNANEVSKFSHTHAVGARSYKLTKTHPQMLTNCTQMDPNAYN